MKFDYKKINKYIDKVIFVLFLFLTASVFFYTAFRTGQWLDQSILDLINKVCAYLDVIKYRFVIRLLFILESLHLILNYLLKEKEFKNQFIRFIIFVIAYELMSIYCPYLRFNELVIILYFMMKYGYRWVLYLFIGIYTINLLFMFYGVHSGMLSKVTTGRGSAFGFSHSNGLALYLFMIYMALVGLLKEKKKILLFISLPFLYVIGFVAKSRTPSYLMVFFIVLLLLEEPLKKIKLNDIVKKVIKYGFFLFPLILFIVSIILAIKIGTGELAIADSFSARFSDFYRCYNEMGLSLGYRDVPTNYYLDNGYSQLLLKFGVVPFIIYMVSFIYLNYRIVQSKDYLLGIVSIVLSIYLMMEFILFFNDLPIILLGYYGFNIKVLKNNSEIE